VGMGLAACANAGISGRKKGGKSGTSHCPVGSEKKPEIYAWDRLADGTELSLPGI